MPFASHSKLVHRRLMKRRRSRARIRAAKAAEKKSWAEWSAKQK